MKRLFFQTKLYDYTSIEAAEKDIEQMKEKGWCPKMQEGGSFIYANLQDTYSYSVEYFKGR